MAQRTISVGIIGSGGMGARHARNLALRTPGADVAMIMDIDTARARAIADECGGARVVNDGHELIDSSEVEAVVIASPDTTHAELTLACLRAGKPVLCEKPLATTPAEAEKILRAEVAGGRRLVQIGLMREFDPPHLAAKQVIGNGDIGRPVLFRGIHINPAVRGVRTVADVIVNSAIHDIHSTRWIMGCEIESVFAQYVPAVAGQPQSCRMVTIQMKLSGGALALIEVNADSGYGYEVDIEVTGETGRVATDSITSPIVHRPGMRSQAIEPDWLVRFETAYIREAQAWIDSLIAGQAIGPSVWDGFRSQQVAQACVESALSGQPVVLADHEKPALYADHPPRAS